MINYDDLFWNNDPKDVSNPKWYSPGSRTQRTGSGGIWKAKYFLSPISNIIINIEIINNIIKLILMIVAIIMIITATQKMIITNLIIMIIIIITNLCERKNAAQTMAKLRNSQKTKPQK